MSINLLEFASILAVTAATPGPQVVAIAAQAMRRGARPAAWMVAGMVIGDVVYLLAVAAGMAYMAEALAGLAVALKWVGILYLCWLATRFWSAGALAEPVAGPDIRRAGGSFLCGLAIVLGNPQSLVFYVTVVPSVTDMAALSRIDLCVLAAVTAVVFAAVQTPFALVALQAQKILESPRVVQMMNRGAALCMSGAAAMIAAG